MTATHLRVEIAEIKDSNEIVNLQESYLTIDNPAVYSEEFVCPIGLCFAIKRGLVVVAKEDNKIIGFLRFYVRKRNNNISLYQFVIANSHRKLGVLSKMLNLINEKNIISYCHKDSTFNNYYKKTGWRIIGQAQGFNHWLYNSRR